MLRFNMSDAGITSEFEDLNIDGSALQRLGDSYKALLAEVDDFAAFLKTKNHQIEDRHFRADIKQELDAIQRVCNRPDEHCHGD